MITHIFKRMVALTLLIVVNLSCQEDDAQLGELKAPTNLTVDINIVGADTDNPYGDGSGVVVFTANADNAVSYSYVYNENINSSPSGINEFSFSQTGVNIYTVTVIANGTGGVSSSKTFKVEVLVNYEPPQALIDLLTSGRWRIKNEVGGHFGLGPVGGDVFGEWFSAPANDKAGTGMYDDRYVFNADGTFTHITDSTNDDPNENTDGTVFGRVGLIDELGSHTITPDGADILNYPLSDYTGAWTITAPDDRVMINLTGTSFIGYYTGGNHSYELVGYDPNTPGNDLSLRTTDGNSEFDWWFLITPEGSDNTDGSAFNTLVWSDEFETNGSLDNTKWTYDLGDGCPSLCGWGNNESQSYTNDPENVIIDEGLLKITAKSEAGGYTSARIKTQDLFEFTHGRVEVRAKLPAGGGTWPAIWMLGANIDEVGWPACGEIDIMEHVGNNIDEVSSALHFPENSGGNAVVDRTTISGATTDFHIYEVEWTSTQIVFSIDGTSYHTFSYGSDVPFSSNNFFIILNVAMGGTLGGTIDPAFTESTMEIDYVRVYQ